MHPMRDEDRSIRLGAAIKLVLRFLGALHGTKKPNPWRAVVLRQTIEHDSFARLVDLANGKNI